MPQIPRRPSLTPPADGPRVVLLVKRTTYQKYVEEAQDARVVDLLAKGDPTVRRMRGAHDDHEATVRETREALAALGAQVHVQRGPRSKVHGTFDLAVTVGGDGTLLAASHQMGPSVPVLGINSSPGHSVGFFCAGHKGSVGTTLRAAVAGDLRKISLTRMRVTLNGTSVHERVLNEALFCHASPAATSRYIAEVVGPLRREVEEHTSSGVWVGPAAGSTAAQRSAGGDVLPLASDELQYVVREPYVPEGATLRMRKGRIFSGERLVLRSKMSRAKLFLDGYHNVFDLSIGDVLTFERSDEPLTVLGLQPRD